MVLVINSGGAAALPEWQTLFAELVPDLRVHGWDDPDVDPTEVRYALVWQPDAGRLATYPGLRMIVSSAAGVDHILIDPSVPAHLPIARMVTLETAERMADFCTMAAYALMRDVPGLVAAKAARRWDESITGGMASETTVGVMGVGQLGAATATRLAANGFRTLGWARTAKTIDKVHCHIGPEELDAFLGACDIIVNLLPDTAQTRGIFNAAAFAKMRRGAGLIHVGRGTQVDSVALLAALESGQLGSAMLDVFQTEPLPTDDPLWTHPRVIVSSHVASAVSRPSKARQAAAAIIADMRGEPVAHLYDRVRGY